MVFAGISPVLGGALATGLIAAAAGLIAYHAPRKPLSEPWREAAASAEIEVEPEADPAPAAMPAVESVAAPVGAAEAEPSFDLVRVAPDGSAVAAGRAAPGSRVTILGSEGPVAAVEADAAGDFVAVFRTTPGTEPQALILEAENADGDITASEDMVVLLPDPSGAKAGSGPAAQDRAAPAPGAEMAAPAAGRLTAGAGSARPAAAEAAGVGGVVAGIAGTQPSQGPLAIASGSAVEDPAPATTEAAPEVAATAVLRGDAAGVSVEASPAETGEGLTLASVSYAETGAVTLAGLGSPGARLRAYIDDRFARDGVVGADGRWTLELADLAAGVYRLRIDALNAGGAVEARLETPFQRDFPAVAGPDGAGRPGSITVQPGNNLWTLARIHYGAGVLYTQIHTANRDLIRDPELIYPGQIFVLPEGAPAD